MKKVAAICLALVMALSITACGGNGGNQTSQEGSAGNGSTATPDTGTGSQGSQSGQDGQDNQGSQTQQTEEDSGSSGGGEQTGDSPDLTKFYEDFMDSLGENAPAMMDANEDASYVDSFFPGLNDYELKQSVLQMAMISAVAFEIDLVECANENDVEAVKGIFQSRLDNQINGGAFYPEATETWEKGELLTNGNVVALIVAGDNQADAVARFNDLF